MDWDFTDFGGGVGVVPEPTTKRLNGYRSMIKRIAHDLKEFRGENPGLDEIDPETMDEDEALDTIDSMDEQMAISEGFQQRSIEAIAFLCGAEWTGEEEDEDRTLVGGSPDLDNLQRLPYRVLQAFSRWLMGELSPKSETGGTPTRPTPTDFSRSRKGGKRNSTSRRATSTKG
jgi:hypothetical protein